jgi:DNA-binding transcriptional LysR family regulator
LVRFDLRAPSPADFITLRTSAIPLSASAFAAGGRGGSLQGRGIKAPAPLGLPRPEHWGARRGHRTRAEGARTDARYVGTHIEIGRRRIAPLIGEFTARYPGITAELVLTDSRLELLESEIDVGLQMDSPTDSNIVSRVALSGRRIVCASPQYLATHAPLQHPNDLLQHDCVRLMRGRYVLDHWAFKEEDRVTQIQVQGSLLTNNAEVAHDWAVAGRAVALKVIWDVQEDLRAGRLIRLFERFECDEAKLYVTYATRTHLPPRLRLFIDFMVSALQKI